VKLLLLGGTADARKVTRILDEEGLLQTSNVASDRIQLIYSIAGLVRMPQVPCEVISGGFSQYGGLKAYVEENGIDAILDVTHPFAKTMSNTAVAVARQCNIPCWRFHRPEWTRRDGDRWELFDSWQELIPALAEKRSVLLTAGQLDQELIDQLAEQAQKRSQQLILRTAAPPRAELPESILWLKAIGPFNEADELALMQQHQVDVLVSKNSGGAATEAKLSAARELGIEVLMLQRPEFNAADQQFDTVIDCVSWLQGWLKRETD